MNLNNAQTFYNVARYRSFTKVATLEGVTQGAISTRIKNLENELKTTLMIRTNYEVTLTPDGDRLFNIIEKMLFEINDYESGLMNLDDHRITPPLRIGISNKASQSHYYHQQCAALYMQHGTPQIVHDTLENLFEKLKSNELDAIFTARYQVPDIDKFKIGQFTLALCAHRDFSFYRPYEFLYPNYFFLTGSSSSSAEIFPEGSAEAFKNSEIIQRVKGLYSIHPTKEESPFDDDLIYLELIKAQNNILTILPDFLIEEAIKERTVQIIHIADLFPVFCYHNTDLNWKLKEKLVTIKHL